MVYKLFSSEFGQNFVVRDDVAWIPMDETNTDYQQYLVWLSEGNTPEPWNPEEVE